MTTIKELHVQRFSVTSAKPFDAVLATIDAAVGHPNMAEFQRQIASAVNFSDVERVVKSAIGPSNFMEFTRYNLGQVMSKERGEKKPRNVRLVLGNPLIMKKMAEHVPDAGSYAPVTILIDERPDGVHLSYDRMASYLASYESASASAVAKELDAEVESLLTSAAV